MKKYEHKYDLCLFEDQKGYLRLAIDKYNINNKSIQSFNNLLDGYNYLNRHVEKYILCPKLCYLQKVPNECNSVADDKCNGACIGLESPEEYNERLLHSLEDVKANMPSFAIVDKGRDEEESSCLLVENGKFYGMGYVSSVDQVPNDLDSLKEKLKPYHSNNYIVNLIFNHANRYPQKLHLLE